MVPDNMDDITHRAVIHYLGLKGVTTKEIYKDMVITLGDDAPSYSIGISRMLNSNIAGIVWKTTFVREGQSLSPDWKLLP